MRWFGLLFAVLTFNVNASFLTQSLSMDLTLVIEESSKTRFNSKDMYRVKLDHHSSAIGLVKNYHYDTNFISSIGLLANDESINFSTILSDIEVAGKQLNLNQIFGIEGKIRFYPITPYVALSYQFKNFDHSLLFNVTTGFKFLTLDDSDITFTKVVGDVLETYPEYSDRYKKQILSKLDKFYVTPVLSIGLKVQFN